MFIEPLTVAVNCWVWLAPSVVVAGTTETLTGGAKVMLALADLVESAALVAVKVTFCGLAIVAGAVYKPALETEPGPFRDQDTPVLLDPVTVAVNRCV